MQPSPSSRHSKIVVGIFFLVGVFALIAPVTQPSPFFSSEYRFSERGTYGTHIVPASCPSSPHYAGECSSSCTPSYSCSGVALYYTDAACNTSFVQNCSAGCTNGACNCVNVCSGNNIVNSCTGALVQACSYLCSSGACVSPPPPSVTFNVTPSIVRSGRTTTVTWSTSNTTACTLTEDNPSISDSWSGVSGTQVSSGITQQTIYTLSCTGIDGSTVVSNKTVNVIPVWEEQ